MLSKTVGCSASIETARLLAGFFLLFPFALPFAGVGAGGRERGGCRDGGGDGGGGGEGSVHLGIPSSYVTSAEIGSLSPIVNSISSSS